VDYLTAELIYDYLLKENMDFTLHYFIISPVRKVGTSLAKQFYVLQKNGAHRWRHRFDCRQHNCPLS
jgi:hypothetical protein